MPNHSLNKNSLDAFPINERTTLTEFEKDLLYGDLEYSEGEETVAFSIAERESYNRRCQDDRSVVQDIYELGSEGIHRQI